MIEAGVISEAILPSSASFPSPAVIVDAPRQTQDTKSLPGDAATGVDIDAQLPSKVRFLFGCRVFLFDGSLWSHTDVLLMLSTFLGPCDVHKERHSSE